MAGKFMPFFLFVALLPLSGYGQSAQTPPSPAAVSRLLPYYYRRTCPLFETIVNEVVQNYLDIDITLAAGLLRMQYQDCFVRGCDASVLITNTRRFPSPEKSAIIGLSLRGFEVIDTIKQRLESTCPGVVSCSDILVTAVRDAVNLVGGPFWTVYLGRKDGNVSLASNTKDLPSPKDNAQILIDKFAAKGLNVRDLVALSGAHTIGYAQCSFFRYRLFHNGTSQPDPTMQNIYARLLRRECTRSTTPVVLDPETPNRFDNQYYINLQKKRGLLGSDQSLTLNPQTSRIVEEFANSPAAFARQFISSMRKMAAINVLTGNKGDVRKSCSVLNTWQVEDGFQP